MNSIKYRKWYLTENWGENQFTIIKEKVNVPRCFPCPYSINFQISHPKVLSGEAFWISHNELCIGYHSSSNPDIFRPIFSYKRHRLLDLVHYGEEEKEKDKEEKDKKTKEEKENYCIINPKLEKARKKYLFGLDKYFVGLDNKNPLPMDCIEIILSYIHSHL